MTESTGTAAVQAVGSQQETLEELSALRGYSKDYWDIVFEQLGRRTLFKVGMAILALLYAVAIYAPLIANDRPYALEAIDYGEYGSAVRSISAVTSSVVRLAETSDEQYLADRPDTAPATRSDALAIEEEAARDRLQVMRAYLPDERQEPLDEYEALLDQTLAAGRAADAARAEEVGDQAKSLARSFRREMKAREPGDEAGDGIELEPVTIYPLFESISTFWAFMMVLWALLMTWPVWNRFVNRALLGGDRERIRRARRVKFLGVLGVSGAAALAWALLVGGSTPTFAAAPFKSGLTAEEEQQPSIVATSTPVFPPIAYGYSETHTEEFFRPPTWTPNSSIDERGYYSSGPRMPQVDAQSGELPPGTPVEVRYAEPDANAWNRHLAGTDELGRDFMTRMIWGGRVSLAVGILSAALLTVIGIVMGSLAGYFGGWVDIAIMRLIEILQSIPAFFLILVVLAFTPSETVPPIFAIVVVIALIRWTGAARLVRGEFLRLREQEFVVASRALGFSNRRTIFRHVLPNALSPVLVNAAFAVASGILTESAISFLGFGVQHPEASWGSLVNETKNTSFWWIQVFPGLLIFITVTCYNLVGDAIRDALDPKMKSV